MQAPATALDDMAQAAGALIGRLRARAPRVHCITNNVAQNFTANVLLAVGCVPSMTLSPDEVAAFAAGAQALMVNLGTFDAERSAAAEIAIGVARENKVPWVLDPVLVERSPQRAAFARHLITLAPAVVRLNAAEFAALAGDQPSPDTAAAWARDHKTVVALSGETDLVADGSRLARIASGHALMARVTAMGCAASALVAACLAVEPDALRAAAAALLIIDIAGEVAAETAQGPGSFAVAMLDALYRLDAATLAARAKVT
jgi:hydroxyethylthiazole kinase